MWQFVRTDKFCEKQSWSVLAEAHISTIAFFCISRTTVGCNELHKQDTNVISKGEFSLAMDLDVDGG